MTSISAKPVIFLQNASGSFLNLTNLISLVLDTVSFYKNVLWLLGKSLHLAYQFFCHMEKSKKQKLKLSVNINSLSPSDFMIYFIFITHVIMFPVKIGCVIIFFIKITLKISVFALTYFNNIVVQ